MQDGETVSFGTCSCGHVPRPPSRDRHPWAVLAGLDDCANLLGPDGGPAESVPAVGETVEVALRFPFVGRIGDPVWTTFDPPLAGYNGYDECPEDLAGFRLVMIRLDSVSPGPLSPGTVGIATVLVILDPLALLARPAAAIEDLGTLGLVGLRPALAVFGPLRRIDVAFEGDVGSWALFHVDKGRAALLAVGRWGAHENEVVAGHRPLSPVEAARFGLDAEPPAREDRREQYRLTRNRLGEMKPMKLLSMLSWSEFAEGESALGLAWLLAILAAFVLVGATAPAAARQVASMQAGPTAAHAPLMDVEVPAVGCATQGQTGDVPAPKLPATTSVSLPARVVGRLASYQMAGGLSVLAPIGWTCTGFSGSTGLTLMAAPTGTALRAETLPKGPAVVRLLVDGGTSGRFRVAEVAARAFPTLAAFARNVAAEGEGTSVVFGAAPGDRLTRVRADTVLFTTPPSTEGLGTLSLAPSPAPVNGFARISGDPRAPILTYLAVRLTPSSDGDDRAIVMQALGTAGPIHRP